jgi:hypothetical protein
MFADPAATISAVTTALFSVVSASNLAILAGAGYALHLATKFGGRIVKSLK